MTASSLQRCAAVALFAVVVRLPVLAPLARHVVAPQFVAVGAILQGVFAAALLGPVDARAGATTFVQSPGNPVRGSVGTPLAVAFTYVGTPSQPQAFTVVGTLPPGLEFAPPGLNGGIVASGTPAIEGTPTEPGVFTILVEGNNAVDASGHTNGIQQEIRFEISGEATLRAPSFTTQPLSQTVNAGVAVNFVVAAEGVPSPVLQWRKNGAAISGATGNVFTILNAQPADAGSYTVEATNAAGRATSATVTLTVNTGQAGRAPLIAAQPRSLTVAAGGLAVLAAVATGEPAPTYQWRRNNSVLPGETAAQLVLREAAERDAANYDVLAANAAGSILSEPARLDVVRGGESRLINLSVRTRLAAGGTFIAGFVVQGRRNVLLRAIGPTLAGFGVAGVCEDPRIGIVDAAGATVARNEDWEAGLAATFAAVGAFPLQAGAKDAAVVQSLAGAHSAVVTASGAGVVLVEGYDAGAGEGSLANLSTRATVGSGDDVLLAGFVITGSVAKTVLVRGIGPTLGGFGVAGTVADPQLEIVGNNAVVLAMNDDWGTTLAPFFGQAGAFALSAGTKDAALIVTLAPGAYTAKLASGTGVAGEGLLEIYSLR